MKFFLSLVFGFIVMTGVAQPVDVVKLISTLKEFHQALIQKNTVSINQQTDKALTFGHSNGWVENKNELMAHLESGKLSYSLYKEDSIQVQINGSYASARFNATINGTMDNVPVTNKLKVLEVWVKKGNRWLLFARQAMKDNS
ncbi:MAG: nuclear transport factor 2 family protein [Ferruginibacter sp.]